MLLKSLRQLAMLPLFPARFPDDEKSLTTAPRSFDEKATDEVSDGLEQDFLECHKQQDDGAGTQMQKDGKV